MADLSETDEARPPRDERLPKAPPITDSCFVCEGTGQVYADDLHTGPAMRCGHCGGTGQLPEVQAVAGQDARLSESSRALDVLHEIHRASVRGYCHVCNERYPCTTISEVDALAEEHARLRTLLKWISDTPWKPTEEAIVEITGYAREALG